MSQDTPQDTPQARPWLTVICPTRGQRAEGLTRLLDSLRLQGPAAGAGVEVLVVVDTYQGPDDTDQAAERLALVQQVTARKGLPAFPFPCRVLECDGGEHAWGHPQRQAGIAEARGAWLWWMADDDLATPASLLVLRAATGLVADEPRPLLFQFMAPWREVIWRPQWPRQLVEGNIDASGIVVPNDPARLGEWTNRYQGDFDFAAATVQRWGRMEFVEHVLCWARPTPAEDWTAHGRRAEAGHEPVRLNLGCGEYPLPQADGWVNVDARQETPADLQWDVTRRLPFSDGTVEEVYAGHLLEHLTPEQVPLFLAELQRILRPGGRFGVLVPDMREVMRRYVLDEPAPVEWPAGTFRDLRDLDSCCGMILFSTEQESPHRWAYDLGTLRRTLERAGFRVGAELDRWHDPRIPVGAWYQCGYDAYAPDAVAAPASAVALPAANTEEPYPGAWETAWDALPAVAGAFPGRAPAPRTVAEVAG